MRIPPPLVPRMRVHQRPAHVRQQLPRTPEESEAIQSALVAVADAQEALAQASVAALDAGAELYEIQSARLVSKSIEDHIDAEAKHQLLDALIGDQSTAPVRGGAVPMRMLHQMERQQEAFVAAQNARRGRVQTPEEQAEDFFWGVHVPPGGAAFDPRNTSYAAGAYGPINRAPGWAGPPPAPDGDAEPAPQPEAQSANKDPAPSEAPAPAQHLELDPKKLYVSSVYGGPKIPEPRAQTWLEKSAARVAKAREMGERVCEECKDTIVGCECGNLRPQTSYG